MFNVPAYHTTYQVEYSHSVFSNSVLPPPPPRYNTANGAPPMIVESANILTHPEGLEHNFQVGEGMRKQPYVQEITD
jgi:hypothetical protein